MRGHDQQWYRAAIAKCDRAIASLEQRKRALNGVPHRLASEDLKAFNGEIEAVKKMRAEYSAELTKTKEVARVT